MKLSSQQLIGLPVYTKSGKHLGQIVSLSIETDIGQVTHFHVRTGLISGLWHQELLIAREQVLSIDEDRMVVDDSVAQQQAKAPKPKPALS